MEDGDACLVGELAHKTKPADTASETSSLPEQKGFRGFVLLDTQDFTGEPDWLTRNPLCLDFNKNKKYSHFSMCRTYSPYKMRGCYFSL